MSAPTQLSQAAPPPVPGAEQPEPSNWLQKIIKRFFSPSVGTIALSIFLALILGALIVAIFDSDVQRTAGYLFAKPGDFLAEFWSAFSGFFTSLFRGAIFDYTQSNAALAIRPLTETLTRAVPLIIAGLAIAVAFTGGLFNIGVQGQLILGATFAAWVALQVPVPGMLRLLLAVIAAIIGGALWGFIPGILKAKLGANEVIVTIMLNSIAVFLIQWLLKKKTFIGNGGTPGKSSRIGRDVVYPQLFGPQFRIHWGFVIALLAAVGVWWLLSRSTFGFALRAAGANPEAAKTAGINVPRVLLMTMIISGALAGLAGTAPVIGTDRVLTNGVAGSLGFDAITVALLGKSSPLGVVLAGTLFGALNAGSSLMQSSAGIPVDIVQITQAIIVLLIAASEAVRYRKETKKVAAVTATATTEGASA